MHKLELVCSLFLAANLVACAPTGTSTEDAGPPDASVSIDAGAPDAGSMDAADSGATDAGAYRPDGGRLQVHWRLEPNGDRDFVEFVDSQLATACTFELAFDGQFRCVPVGTQIVEINGYTDGSCSFTPVMAINATGPVPGQVLVIDPNDCPRRFRLFSVGPEVTVGMIFSRASPSDSCHGFPRDPGLRYFELGPLLPQPDWVRAEIIETAPGTPAGSDIVPAARVIVDGREVRAYGLFDEANGVVCTEEVVDADVRCTPPTPEQPSAFTDSTCTVSAFGGTWNQCRAASRFGRDRAQPQAWFRLNQPALTTVWWGAPGSCNGSPPPADTSWFSGTPVPITSFPLATNTNVGMGRLQRRHLVWPGTLHTPKEWLDTQLGVECQRFGAADGTNRCFPVTTGVSFTNRFADAQCTEPLASAWGGHPPSPSYVAVFDRAILGTRAFMVGAEYSGSMYRRTSAGCVAATASTAMYRVSTEIPTADLARFDAIDVYE